MIFNPYGARIQGRPIERIVAPDVGLASRTAVISDTTLIALLAQNHERTTDKKISINYWKLAFSPKSLEPFSFFGTLSDPKHVVL
jgi:hypothetical protein